MVTPMPPQQQDGHPDAHGLERLDAGLDVIAVAGHPADEAGQAEPVELSPREVGRPGEQVLPDVIGDVVGVVHRDPVGRNVQLAGGQGGEDHQPAPEHRLAQLAQGHHLVDQMLQDIGDHQLGHRPQQLDPHGLGNPGRILFHIPQNQFHKLPPRVLPAPQRAFFVSSNKKDNTAAFEKVK